tara:strand:+ start:1012 stop:1701 length:690 start_codon:yes stop_codon:yes gene_type:complete
MNNLGLINAVKFIRLVPILFLVGIGIAIYFYPGGNIHDSSQAGYSFTHNFLSDLGGYKSHSGEVNFLSSFFFGLSLVLFFFAGIAFLYVPYLFKDNALNFKLALGGSIFFAIGSIFFAGVGLTPHDLYMEMHIFFALNAFRLLIPASFLFLIVLYRSKVENYFTFTILFLMLSTFAYVLYQVYGGNPLENIDNMSQQATIQKLIVLANVLCVFIISYAFSKQYEILNKK